MIKYMHALKDEAKKAGVESSGVILQYGTFQSSSS